MQSVWERPRLWQVSRPRPATNARVICTFLLFSQRSLRRHGSRCAPRSLGARACVRRVHLQRSRRASFISARHLCERGRRSGAAGDGFRGHRVRAQRCRCAAPARYALRRKLQRLTRASTCTAVAAFLRAAQLTPRQLRENSTLVNALARQHVVPLVRPACCWFRCCSPADWRALRCRWRFGDWISTPRRHSPRSHSGCGARYAAGASHNLRGNAVAALQTLRVRPTAGVYIVVADRSSAVITVPDIVAGGAILHVINDMLIPAGVDVEL